MARNKHKNTSSFAGIPRHIIEHKSYKSLGYAARSLLIHLAYQYKGKNNGNLVITWSLLSEWFGHLISIEIIKGSKINKNNAPVFLFVLKKNIQEN